MVLARGPAVGGADLLYRRAGLDAEDPVAFGLRCHATIIRHAGGLQARKSQAFRSMIVGGMAMIRPVRSTQAMVVSAVQSRAESALRRSS